MVVKYCVRYEGSILGRGVRAVLTERREGESPQTIFNGDDKGTAVLMILNDSVEEIRVFEKGSKEGNKLYKINRIC
jgi:hypothetical protein